jgi:hypothetical protein
VFVGRVSGYPWGFRSGAILANANRIVRVNRSLSLRAVARCAMSLALSSTLRSFAGFVHHHGPAVFLSSHDTATFDARRMVFRRGRADRAGGPDPLLRASPPNCHPSTAKVESRTRRFMPEEERFDFMFGPLSDAG